VQLVELSCSNCSISQVFVHHNFKIKHYHQRIKKRTRVSYGSCSLACGSRSKVGRQTENITSLIAKILGEDCHFLNSSSDWKNVNSYSIDIAVTQIIPNHINSYHFLSALYEIWSVWRNISLHSCSLKTRSNNLLSMWTTNISSHPDIHNMFIFSLKHRPEQLADLYSHLVDSYQATDFSV